MAGMNLNSVGLNESIAHVFRARNILTAKEALYKTELELVELLDVPMEEVQSALAIISAKLCPPCHSVFDILSERAKKEPTFGHLPTGLPALDEYLWGGIPFGVMTEIVGPAGIGKTQFCLLLSTLAAMPEELGGLDGSVIYIDTEKKFRAGRLLQIAKSRFPEHFNSDQRLEQLATRVLTVQPATVAELMLRLQGLEEGIRQHGVRFLVIDSVAALMQSITQRQEILGRQASILKRLAEAYRMPIVITNQVRSQGGPGGIEIAFTTAGKKEIVLTPEAASLEGLDLQLTAALGTKWAHAVNIRLVLESISGNRYIKIAKSPMSATIAFRYEVTAAGIVQIGDETFDASDGEETRSSGWCPTPLCFANVENATYIRSESKFQNSYHLNHERNFVLRLLGRRGMLAARLLHSIENGYKAFGENILKLCPKVGAFWQVPIPDKVIVLVMCPTFAPKMTNAESSEDWFHPYAYQCRHSLSS